MNLDTGLAYIDEASRQLKYVVHRQGKVLTAKVIVPSRLKPDVKSRSVIHGFSDAARLRLLKSIARINWSVIPQSVFITLTYPDSHADRTTRQRNIDRHRFIRYMEHHLGKRIYGIWRVEWKRRKSGVNVGNIAPHFHLLVMRVPFIPYKKIRLWWRKCLGVKGPLSTHIRRCVNGELASVYAAKYVSKRQDAPYLDDPAYLNRRGRHYGFMRRKLIPLYPLESALRVEPLQFEAAYNEACKLMPWLIPGRPDSFTGLGVMAEKLYVIFRKYGVAFQRFRG